MFGIFDLFIFGAAIKEIHEESKPARPIMGFNWDLYWKDVADGKGNDFILKARKNGRYNIYK